MNDDRPMSGAGGPFTGTSAPVDPCEEALALALLLEDGPGDPAWSVALQCHLAVCPSCVLELKALRGVGTDVATAFASVPALPDQAPVVLDRMRAAAAAAADASHPGIGVPGSVSSTGRGARGERPFLLRRLPLLVGAAAAAALLLVVDSTRPGFSSRWGWQREEPTSTAPETAASPTAARLVVVDAAAAGVGFRHSGPVDDPRWIFEAVGSGVSASDLDGDGLPELVLPDAWSLDAAKPAGAGHRIYRNLGGRKFRDVTEGSGIDTPEPVTGVLAADLDGDGLRDLVLCGYGRVRVLRNLGDLRFRDVSAEAGFAAEPGSWFTCAAAADLDGDGHLDLYVTRYADLESHRRNLTALGGTPGRESNWRGIPVFAGPEPLVPQSDRLYRGRGDFRFEDVTAAALPEIPARYGFQVVATDADGDGRLDLYVANDAQANFLWQNEGGMRFREVALASGAAFDASGRAQAGMGVAVGDTHGDGLPDILVTNFSHDHLTYYAYYRGQGAPGKPRFDDRSYPSGVGPASSRYLAWGCVFADIDRDGEEDLLVANGHLYPRVGETGGGDVTYAEPLQAFLGKGGGFEEAVDGGRVALAGATPRVHRGLARADFDGDGRLDFVASVLGGAPVLLFGEGEPEARWIGFRLRGSFSPGHATGSPRDAAGARVGLVASGRRQTRELHLGDSFAGASDPTLHFGLGDAAMAQNVTVRWPSGRTETFPDLGAGHVHELVEGEGR